MDKKSPEERYAYLINKIMETNELWLLQATDGMFAMIEDDNEQFYVPVWPEKEYAEMHVNNEWEEYEATVMSVKELMKWVPELKQDKVFIGAFPGADYSIVPIDPQQFIDHIRGEE